VICRAELPELVCYTFGYGGRDPKELAAFVAEYEAVVIDVRLKPWTKQKGWSLPELKKRFGDQYHWVRALGNTNFRGGRIKLLDPKKGMARLMTYLEAGTPPLLLCGERSPNGCHRSAIAHMVARKTGARVVHLPALECQTIPKPQQLSLDLLKRRTP
jgi:uncharacterized protein (DUF488 family)